MQAQDNLAELKRIGRTGALTLQKMRSAGQDIFRKRSFRGDKRSA